MIQERFLDLEQQKKFLTYLNKKLKNKVVLLESQKEVLSEVLERGISCKAPAKIPKKPNFGLFYAMTVSAVLLISTVAVSSYLLHDSPEIAPLKTRYLTENLRGDTVDTWKFWKLDSESTMVVSIVN